MKKFAIIGLGTFGSSLAKSLTEKGAEVIAIDRDMERVEAIQDYVTIAVRLDSTDENALASQGIADVDAAVVCIGEDFESNLLTSVMLLNMGVKNVVTRATRDIEEKILKAVGIERVINPEMIVGERLAYTLMHPALKEIFYLAGELTVAEVESPRDFVGKSLEELALRRKFGLNLIVIQTIAEKKEVNGKLQIRREPLLPTADTVIKEGDLLTVVGHKKDISKLAELAALTRKNEN